MLVQMTYASRVARSLGPLDVKDILAASGRNNKRLGVSGALCLHSGIFLQVLEGDRTAVSSLYQHILADDRHKDAVILDFSEITQRRFTRWNMGLLAATEDNRELFLRYSAGAEFDPYGMSASGLRALFDEVQANVRWIS